MASIILATCGGISFGIFAFTITNISPVRPPEVRHFPAILNLVPGCVNALTLSVRFFPYTVLTEIF